MRKWIIVPIVFFMVIFVSELSAAKYEGVHLGDSDLYKELKLDSGNLLRDIEVLPETEYDKLEVSRIINRLDYLPDIILEDVYKNDIKLVLFTGDLTDNESAAHLKGQVPRGYPESILWEDVPGIGGSKLVLVKIGSSELGRVMDLSILSCMSWPIHFIAMCIMMKSHR